MKKVEKVVKTIEKVKWAFYSSTLGISTVLLIATIAEGPTHPKYPPSLGD